MSGYSCPACGRVDVHEYYSELQVKYGRDHSGKTTLQELIDKFLAAQPSGVDAFCDVVDEEFICKRCGNLYHCGCSSATHDPALDADDSLRHG